MNQNQNLLASPSFLYTPKETVQRKEIRSQCTNHQNNLTQAVQRLAQKFNLEYTITQTGVETMNLNDFQLRILRTTDDPTKLTNRFTPDAFITFTNQSGASVRFNADYKTSTTANSKTGNHALEYQSFLFQQTFENSYYMFDADGEITFCKHSALSEKDFYLSRVYCPTSAIKNGRRIEFDYYETQSKLEAVREFVNKKLPEQLQQEKPNYIQGGHSPYSGDAFVLLSKQNQNIMTDERFFAVSFGI